MPHLDKPPVRKATQRYPLHQRVLPTSAAPLTAHQERVSGSRARRVHRHSVTVGHQPSVTRLKHGIGIHRRQPIHLVQ